MIQSSETFSIRNKAKGKLPRLPFLRIKEAVLGLRYELSITCVSSSVSRKLNRVHRGKDKPTNVLSFPLSEHSGEIIFDLKQTALDAPLFGVPPRAFLGRLFIHALLHLKGFTHGSTMDKKERLYAKRFSIRM